MYSEYLVQILLFLGYTQYDELDGSGDFEVSQSGGVVTLTWHNTDPGDDYYPDGPTPEDISAQEKPWAAKEKRLGVKAWASQLNSRAYETTLPDAVDNMLTQDVRHATRAQTNGNTQEINSALDAAFANAITTIETARDDPIVDLNANVKKGVDVVLAGFATLSDILGSVLISNAESKEDFKTRPRFHLILMGGEARGLMKQEINVVRDDPQSTVQDILDYAVDDANASAVHAAAYPTESPTLATRLAEYPEDYEQ